MTAPDPFLTARDVAAWLNVPPATVKDWRRRRTGPPSLKVGGAVRYRPADVEAWLELQREDPPAVPRPLAPPSTRSSSRRTG